MKRREDPATETPPVDRAKVRALLEEANALRESGVNLHHHATLLALEAECDSIMAYHVFAWYPDSYKLTDAELDELADGLVRRAAP